MPAGQAQSWCSALCLQSVAYRPVSQPSSCVIQMAPAASGPPDQGLNPYERDESMTERHGTREAEQLPTQTGRGDKGEENPVSDKATAAAAGSAGDTSASPTIEEVCFCHGLSMAQNPADQPVGVLMSAQHPQLLNPVQPVLLQARKQARLEPGQLSVACSVNGSCCVD